MTKELEALLEEAQAEGIIHHQGGPYIILGPPRETSDRSRAGIWFRIAVEIGYECLMHNPEWTIEYED